MAEKSLYVRIQEGTADLSILSKIEGNLNRIPERVPRALIICDLVEISQNLEYLGFGPKNLKFEEFAPKSYHFFLEKKVEGKDYSSIWLAIDCSAFCRGTLDYSLHMSRETPPVFGRLELTEDEKKAEEGKKCKIIGRWGWIGMEASVWAGYHTKNIPERVEGLLEKIEGGK